MPDVHTRACVLFSQWGGHNWWQNWRLPYYSMAAAGDTDLLVTMFQFFANTLPLAQVEEKGEGG